MGWQPVGVELDGVRREKTVLSPLACATIPCMVQRFRAGQVLGRTMEEALGLGQDVRAPRVTQGNLLVLDVVLSGTQLQDRRGVLPKMEGWEK